MRPLITWDANEAVRALADAQRSGDRRVTLEYTRDGYRVARMPRRIDARDRVYYFVTFRAALPVIEAVARRLPARIVRALANRSDRREAEARYAPVGTDRANYLAAEARRVGVLRRMAVDRYDARASAAVVYYLELRRRSEGS